MKFYCVLFDSMPYYKELENICKGKNINFHHQVSHSFTFTSIFSLMTGYLPSQVFENGIGYHSEPSVLEKNEIQLFDKLDKRRWKIYLHNSVWMENVIYNRYKFPRTSSIRNYENGENSGMWNDPKIQNLLCNYSEESIQMTNREIEHIKNIQNNKSDFDEFHFIIYHHHHEAVNTNLKNFNHLDDSVFRIINAWDFEEEDSIFWFFADHGNFKKIDEFSSPPHAWTTWVLSKDNVKKRKSNHGLISILDFLPTYSEELGIKYEDDWIGESIYGPFNKDRIFFCEDGRAEHNLYNSTTCCAISCKEWNEFTPSKIEQTSFFSNTCKYKSFNFDYNTREIFDDNLELFDIHISKMKNIFKWM